MPDMEDEAPAVESEKKRGPRKASEVIAETEERVRAEAADEIAQLRAQLAQAEKEKADALEAQAVAEANRLQSAADQLKVDEITEVSPEEPDSITVNFVSNDMTILGRSWYQGQELTIKPGTPEWDELWDAKRNKSYLEYTEDEQVLIWGERKFRPGRWKGVGYEELLNSPDLSDEDREALQSILEKRKSRDAVPAGYTTSTSKKRSPVAYS